ncbi:LOW QUALITY PROTEIN: Mnd1 family-domain-containing protein [Endogone sp. FLAS-F59071]|nr:LOW QUALITY PROTEIN: Mnd1 family-domain-containing protein [Endogone sp. FLAS-F59071]|eukprot:RUS17132.1 LOW QUALITY PROTEIN: Mnd1 family-domain-containing protein [Endogone sp. FLAS-F59071]
MWRVDAKKAATISSERKSDILLGRVTSLKEGSFHIRETQAFGGAVPRNRKQPLQDSLSTLTLCPLYLLIAPVFDKHQKEFFQLKELEKLAPKKKGIACLVGILSPYQGAYNYSNLIVAQSVKEVLQSLVDDNLVTTDKIGTSNYFWSFPSTALQTRKRKIDELTEEITKLKAKNVELEQAIQESFIGRENTEERTELLRELEEAETRQKTNKAELEQYSECDPVRLEAKERAAKAAKDAANRWTENIFAVQSYCVRTLNIEREAFNENFGIPEDFDTIP